MGIIYLAENSLNKKVYIGQTKGSLKSRMHAHINSALNARGFYFANAIKKYGIDTFTWKILEDDLSEEELDSKERYYISFYDSTNPDKGYNLDSGGHTQKKRSEITKRKIGQANKGKVRSEKTREKIREAKKYISEETREKMRRAQKERFIKNPVSETTIKKWKESNKNMVFTEEHRRKISEGSKKRELRKKEKLRLDQSGLNIAL